MVEKKYDFTNEDDRALYQYAKGNAWEHNTRNLEIAQQVINPSSESFIVRDYDNYGNEIDLKIDNQFLFGMHLIKQILIKEIAESGGEGEAYAQELQDKHFVEMMEGRDYPLPIPVHK